MAYQLKDVAVAVDWVDAWSSGPQWMEHDDIELKGDINVRTIGYVSKHDKKGILLYTSGTSHGSFGGYHFVPKGMIKKITVLN